MNHVIALHSAPETDRDIKQATYSCFCSRPGPTSSCTAVKANSQVAGLQTCDRCTLG